MSSIYDTAPQTADSEHRNPEKQAAPDSVPPVESSEQPYRRLFENAAEGLYRASLSGQYITVNRALALMCGCAGPEEFSDHYSTEGSPLYVDAGKRATAISRIQDHGAITGCEFEVFSRDGNRFWISESAWAIHDDGGSLLGYEGIIADITEQHLAKKNQIKNTTRLAEAVESLQEAFALFDDQDRLVMYNRVYPELFPLVKDIIQPGVPFETLIRTAAERGQNFDSVNSAEEWINNCLEAHKQVNGRFDHNFADGRCIWVKEGKTPEGYTISTYVDVTELKHRESAVHVREQHFHNAADAAGDWMWEIDANLCFTHFSDSFDEITGLRAKNFLGKTYIEIVKANSSDQAGQKHYEDIVARRAFHDFIYSLEDESKRTRHLRISGKPVLGANGDFQGYRGTGVDITAHIEARTKTDRHTSLLNATFDNVSQGICIVDEELNIAEYNQRFLDLLNLPPELFNDGATFADVIRLCAARGDFGPGEVDDLVNERVAHAERFEVYKFEQTLSTGRVLEITSNPLPGSGFVRTYTDITDRKQMKSKAERLGRILESSWNEIYVFDAVSLLFIQVNNAARRNLKYSSAELRERTLVDIAPEISADDFAGIIEPLATYRCEHVVLDTVFQRKDGSTYPVEIRLQLSRFEKPQIYVAFVLDNTERKQAELAVVNINTRMKEAIESLDEGFAYFDAEERLVLCNEKYREIHGDLSVILEEGTCLEDIIEIGSRSGLVKDSIGREEEWTKQRLSEYRNPGLPIEQQLGNGHWVLASIHRSKEGGITSIRTDITEMKQREQALVVSEQRFRDVADVAGDWIWEMGPDLRFVYVSDRFQEATSISARDILGKTRQEIMKALASDSHWQSHLQDLETHRPFRDFRYSHTDSSGHTHYFRTSGKPIFDNDGTFIGYRGTGANITNQVEAQAKVDRQSALLQATFDNMIEGIVVVDCNLNVAAFNARYMELFDLPRDLVTVGTPYERVIRYATERGEWGPGDIDDMVRTWVDKLKDREAYSAERERPNGKLLNVNGNPMPDGVYVYTFTDITEKKKLEEDFRQAQKMEAIGRLTGGVAHEFNNLLTAIGGFAHFLNRDPGDPETVKEWSQNIIDASDQAASLTGQLLAFSRKQVLEPKIVKVSKVINETRALIRPVIDERSSSDCKVDIDIGDDECSVMADPGRLSQALLNLSINARDAMPDGGTLSISSSVVHLDESYLEKYEDAQVGPYARISVTDNGTGIEEDILTDIFEPFFTTKSGGSGTGLGLSMVYGMVKQSGGIIDVKSQVGRGTTFSIYLPLIEDVTIPDEESTEALAEPLGNETILVAEDEMPIRQLARITLEGLGYTVLMAPDGEEAVELYNKHADSIDLLLTDLKMPGMNGWELAKQLTDNQPNLKVLYMTGFDPESERAHRRGIGEDVKILHKPFDPDQLGWVVREILDTRSWTDKLDQDGMGQDVRITGAGLPETLRFSRAGDA